jgi:hypothetical protein
MRTSFLLRTDGLTFQIGSIGLMNTHIPDMTY